MTSVDAVDADVRDLLHRLAEMGMRSYPEMGVLRSRAVVESSTWMQGDKTEVPSIREVLVSGAAGLLPARVYHPQPDTVLPLVLYFHGGGWVTGSVAVADRPCRTLAIQSRCVVVSVEYRRAPETQFPGPAEDCFAALTWVAGHAAELSADPGRLAVAGDSAGGNLAAAVTLMARDRGGPIIAHQLLLYPCLLPVAGNDFPSYRANAEGFMLTRADLEWFWAHYLPVKPAERPEYAAPLLASDLSGLPAATVITAQFDPLRDEGNAYAQRLRDEGSGAESIEWPGMIHGFFWMAGELAQARELAAYAGTALRTRLGLGQKGPG